jgi:tRNA nucleotidyltransferase (CCA-adding enzyme)
VSAVDLRTQLERLISPAQYARLAQVRDLAARLGLPLYLAGGVVRDLLLSQPPADVDVVVEGDAPTLARAAAREWGGQVLAHAPFGTASWVAPDGVSIDFASTRTEVYLQPAALPQVQAPATLQADLARRDFTINSLALRLDGPHFGELIDPFHGQADLAARQVRVLHPRSFQDDPTRMFRAVRYEGRLGFAMTADTLALIPGAWPALAALSADRVRHEFELIFREPNVLPMLARLAELAILSHVHPALAWDDVSSAQAAIIPRLPKAEWRCALPLEPDALYLALLLRRAPREAALEALQRLNPNAATRQAVLEALALHRNWSRPSEAVAALDKLSELGVVAAYVLRPEWQTDLHAYLAHWRHVRAETTGEDLIARGLTPGPRFKALLWELRAARLDGTITDQAGERAWLERQLARPE